MHASRPADVEQRIRAIGEEIISRSRAEPSGERFGAGWQDRLLAWAMDDAALRTQLFRFIDVLPSLASHDDVAEHLAEYLGGAALELPAPLGLGRQLAASNTVGRRVAAVAARRNVRHMARRFIAGESVREAIATVERLRRRGLSFTMDVLGEVVSSDRQADAYAGQYLTLIDALADHAASWPAVPLLDEGRAGPLPRANVSLKLSALDPRFDPIAPSRSTGVVGRRLRPILRRARDRGAAVTIDMETYAEKDLVLDLVRALLMEDEFRDVPHVGLVLQAYLEETERDARDVVDWARRRGCPVTVRLVKGAYWDMEVVRAAQHGWPCPVLLQKWETDAAFERLSRYLLEHSDVVRPAIASQNVRSLAHAMAWASACGLSRRDYELQMLLGMGDPLQQALVAQGVHVRIYAPYGPLLPGMGYLIRRLLENTSNESFLRQSFAEDAPVDELLAPPETQRPAAGAMDLEVAGDGGFCNEPPADFSREANRTAMAAAIRAVQQRAGAHVPLVIRGQRVASRQTLPSLDPSSPSRVLGEVASADAGHVEAAVAAAAAAWPPWRDAPVAQRAALLRRLAQIMRQRRFELAALAVLESGKPWREADGDVTEAIDYCECYAAAAEALQGAPRRRDVPGERNAVYHEARGVTAVIAPWNFPLAILTGMTAAALVTGNTVILKPAEQSPVMGAQLMAMLEDAGLAPGVANFLPGRGEDVGARLVGHPDVATIAFTGSRDVGLGIVSAAAHVAAGQRFVKRVIAEMGGKNAIIVDADADLDEAVAGVAASAFGYAGQKCSACSRVVVLAPVHAAFVQRLVDTAQSLPVGPAEDPATVVGPLIDDEAQRRVRVHVERGAAEARLVCAVAAPPGDGYFVGPVIFDEVPPSATIARQEIFGPVLSVMAASDFDEALRLALDSDYALTGGLYSRHPAHIERARREFRVGNLYVNRAITGALVDRQPFGGLRLSGLGTKAGGPDYLQQFCVERTVTENTVRHGFAPPGGE